MTMKLTCWIPEQFAVLGKVLKLRTPSYRWQEGWVVTEVGETVLLESELHSGQYRYHRCAKQGEIGKDDFLIYCWVIESSERDTVETRFRQCILTLTGSEEDK